MFHFATPDDSPSPAEDELFRVLGDDAAHPDPLWPLGLLLFDASPHLILVVIAAAIGLGADERWAW